jgi:putative protein-disulfide isomerase
MNPQLVYAFDPLCGWCYGFGPALRAVRAALPDLAIELRFGGLVTGGRIGPYADKRAYIEAAQVRLRAVTGLAPGSDFHARILQDPSVIASSIPPCDVLLQLRSVAPGAVPDFAEAIQTAHFRDGVDFNDPGLYDRIAGEIGLDFHPDVPRPDELRPELAAQFATTAGMGVSSYPTLFLRSDADLRPITLDYAPAGQLAAVEAALGAIAH